MSTVTISLLGSTQKIVPAVPSHPVALRTACGDVAVQVRHATTGLIRTARQAGANPETSAITMNRTATAA